MPKSPVFWLARSERPCRRRRQLDGQVRVRDGLTGQAGTGRSPMQRLDLPAGIVNEAALERDRAGPAMAAVTAIGQLDILTQRGPEQGLAGIGLEGRAIG